MINLGHRFRFRRLGIVGRLGYSVGFCSPDFALQRASLTGNHPCSVSFPICSQPSSEHIRSFDELLLLFDPWRYNFLLLDDFIHEVFGRI